MCYYSWMPGCFQEIRACQLLVPPISAFSTKCVLALREDEEVFSPFQPQDVWHQTPLYSCSLSKPRFIITWPKEPSFSPPRKPFPSSSLFSFRTSTNTTYKFPVPFFAILSLFIFCPISQPTQLAFIKTAPNVSRSLLALWSLATKHWFNSSCFTSPTETKCTITNSS